MLSEIAREAARRFGDRPVVVAPDGVLTYAQLDDAAERLAAGLAHRGVAESDVVALLLPSGGDWLVAAVAAARLGAVFVGISPALAEPERAALVRLVAPRLTLADPSLVAGLPLRADVAVLAPGGRGAELMAPAGVTAPHVAIHDDSPAVICCTSGTTGRPKAATFRVRQLRAVQRIDLGPDAEQRWDGGSPMLASTQFAHVGMSTKLPWYLRTGSTLHVMERWRADDALRLVAEHRMPTIGVVAPQLALMLRSPLLDELDLTCVQAVIAGGAASPPTLVQEARRRLGAAYSIRYSSTESGGVGIGTAFDADDDEALHTIGRPRPGVEVRITGEGDQPVPDGTVGELQLRSDAAMSGYWNDPEATRQALSEDGWLRTGDLARLDAAGRVVLAGRRTEMFIRGGYNVFPSEVEAVLSSHPEVLDVVVVPRPDEVMGEVGLALVVPRDPSAPPTLASLRDHGQGELARHKLPEQLLVTGALPLTSAQKIDRAAAAEEVADHLDGVQDRATAADGNG
ncbi:MAG: class I adenylate-forming enzyme family protein [Microthrixaceae bacterium]